MSRWATSTRLTRVRGDRRLPDRRRRLRGLRAGGSSHRGRQGQRTAARVRWLGPLAVDPDAQRAVDSHEHGALRLALLHRAGAAPEWPPAAHPARQGTRRVLLDRKSTRLNSSHLVISYAVFCLKKKKKYYKPTRVC